MDEKPTFVKRHALVIFFAMAYLLSWMWVPVAAFLDGPFLFPIGPLVAALIMVTATGTWRELLGRVFRWRVPIVWYAAAILVPAAISLAALSTTMVFSTPNLAALGPWVGLLLMFPSAILDAPFFEEPGWRGFGLPRFPANRSRFANTAILGLLLVGWHAPLTLFEPAAAPAYLLGTFASAFVTNWVYYNSSESALLAMLYHSVANTFGIFLAPALSGTASLQNAWLLTGVTLLVAVVILVATNGTMLSRSTRRMATKVAPPPLTS